MLHNLRRGRLTSSRDFTLLTRRLSLVCWAAVLVFISAVPGRVGAQAGEDVPIGDNAYVYLDALLARGCLQSLSALERPYNLPQIVRALQTEVPANPSRAVRGYITGLRRSLAKYDVQQLLSPAPRPKADALSWQVGANVGGTAQTSSIRDLMHDNDVHGAFGDGGIQGAFAVGPATAVIHEVLLGELNADPEYHPPRVLRSDAVRTQEGYIDARWPIFEVFVGREARNWGPTMMSGLVLGDYAYTYDHLYFQIGVPQFRWQFLTTRLNDEPDGDTAIARYFSIHRFASHIGRVEFGVEESILYGGPGQSYDFHYLNPFNVFTFSELNEENGGSGATKKYSVEGAWRSPVGTFSAQAFLNDVQLFSTCNPVVLCKKPTSGGWTLAAEGIPFIGDQRLFASYTLVSSLAYRTYEQPWTDYTSEYVSLGRGYSDYDQWQLGVDLAVIPEVPLKVYGAYSRQGQGYYEYPYPPIDSFPETPAFLIGVVSYVYRGAVSGAVSLPWVEVNWDTGIYHVVNYQHVEGVHHTAVSGRVQVSLEWARIFGGRIKVPSSSDPDRQSPLKGPRPAD
jgi:hypothetical protein